MPKKEAGVIAPIILLLLLVLVVIGFLAYRGLVKIPGLPQSSTASVDLQSQYQNPFDKSAQYVNPFSSYKNPFDSLK
ncbi:MAG: hypothetical protein HYW45_03740 [Candidatus Daviesbacteria bacterium]|nr:MAG: hypothetical protein HYW45_03740 [Candidatus Daviesbacteria bacterium]